MASSDFSDPCCFGVPAHLCKIVEQKLTVSTALAGHVVSCSDRCPSHCSLSIDGLTIPSKRPNGGVLRRVSEVFDCWFESGSMPYAQAHYPFENRREFEDGFPGDFIAEGIDQTRGW